MNTENNSNNVKKIVIDRQACTGAETCAILAPEAFELDSEGIAVLKDTWSNHSEAELIAAAKSCPTQAIKLLDENGNEISLA